MNTDIKIYSDKEFIEKYTYTGKDLGATWSKDATTFKVWAPTAQKVELALYQSGNVENEDLIKQSAMTQGDKGVWELTVEGDLNGTYYTYRAVIDGVSYGETADPYAKAVGVNGERSMVVDLDSTDPDGWDQDTTNREESRLSEIVVWEVHVRDFSIDASSGVSEENRGKFKAFTEKDTTVNGEGKVASCVNYLKQMGVTHVQLLPAFDYDDVDETKVTNEKSATNYNWGYNPKNYNCPDGSYSSNPYDGNVRIKEMKEMIQALHKAGIKVIMDVVYNHTYATADSCFNKIMPDYYYKLTTTSAGKVVYNDESGCGNATRSDSAMFKKYMMDSLEYWVDEYHIDGFRFDLMGIHARDTMNAIRKDLDEKFGENTIVMYGEGWTGGTSSLSSSEAVLKANMPLFGEMQIGAFSDDIRDGIKGHVFTNTEPAFVNGGDGFEDTIKFGIVGSTKHEGIDYSNIGRDHTQVAPWANEPYQTITYASVHDNLALWDRLQTTNPDATDEELQAMNKMSAAIVYTSQGIPFMQAGEEFARTKVKEDGTLDENSYSSPDSVNQLNWSRKGEYSDLFNYYKGLIELRKSHKAFRMNSTEDIQNNLTFLTEGTDFTGKNVVAYTLKGTSVGDSWENIAVVFNANEEDVEVTLPTDDWTVVVDGAKAGVEELAKITGNKVTVPAGTSYVLVDTKSYEESKVVTPDGDEEEPKLEEVKKDTQPAEKDNKKTSNTTLTKTGSVGTTAVIAVGMGLVLIGALVIRKRQRN